MRQSGEDEQTRLFWEVLEQMREYRATPESFDLLCSRMHTNLPAEELENFVGAPRIFTTKAEVADYNYNELTTLGMPCKKIKSINTGTDTEKASSTDADNLDTELIISIGAHMIHIANLWVEHGLMNGTMGIVIDIAWNESQDPRNDQPAVVMVKFDDYESPTYDSEHLPAGSAPIFPVTRTFQYLRGTCTRTQFPLRLAYALTVHKSQGVTLKKAAIGLGKSEFAMGLSYVAISRVKKLTDLIFISPFDLERLNKGGQGPQAYERLTDWNERSRHLI